MHLRQGLVFYTFLLSFLLFTQESSAQINNNRFRVDLISQEMGPCGGPNDGATVVIVTAKSNTVNNFEIVFDLPDGVQYNAGTAQITNQQGSSDYTLTEVDITNLNQPRFRIERPADATWEVADRVRFRIGKTANCQAVEFSYSGGLFKDAHTIFYNDQNGPQTASDNDPTINTYNFRRALLAVVNYSNTPGSVGQTINRPLDITNSGNGTIRNFQHNVVVDPGLGNYSLVFNGTALVPASVSGNTFTYDINLSAAPFFGNVGDGDGIFENETISLVETFEVLDCNNSSVSHQPTWGCSPTELCQLFDPVSAAIVLNTSLPEIRVTETFSTTATDLCQLTQFGATIGNTSSEVAAYDVFVNFGFGINGGSTELTTPTQNPLWGNDRPNNTKALSDFRLGGLPISPEILPNTEANFEVGPGSFLISNTLFTSDPDGPGGFEDLDGDGYFDDLAPGASSFLTFNYENIPDSPSCGTPQVNYLKDMRLYTDAYAYNQCGDLTDTERVNLGNTVLARRIPTIQFPTDVFDGSPFTVGIQADLFTGGFNALQCAGQDLFTNDPSSRWTVTLTVPAGISLSGSPAGFTQVDANTIVYTTTDLTGGNRFRDNVQFPLIMNCSGYSGPSEIPISYSTRYECSCFSEEMYCGDITGIRSQCVTDCANPRITSFDAQRTTAGWTDNTMSTRVNLDPSTHNTDTYMARDEMLVSASAVMDNANPDNLWFDLTYSTDNNNAGRADIIQFLEGNITINDISSGSQSTSISVLPVLINDGPNDYRLRFDLSSYTGIIGPTYTYGEPTSALGAPDPDEVQLELRFVFNDNFDKARLFSLSNFSGEFYSNDLLGNKVAGCTILGDQVNYFMNRIDAFQNLSLSAVGCRDFNLQLILAQTSVGSDQFPNEFRPPVFFQSVDIEIPPGLEYLNSVTSNFSGSPSTSDGGLIVTQNGSILTIQPGTNFRHFDQINNVFPTLRISVRGSSTLSDPFTTSWDYNYREFAYADNPSDITETDTRTFSYTRPLYSLTSDQPVVSGDQVSATFEVDLCMDSSSAIDFNWLQISNGSDFTVLNAYEVSGGSRIPLNVVAGSGNTWIEAGSLTAGNNSCKKIEFEIDFTRCDIFDFEVSQAWECGGYPADFSTAVYENPFTFQLEPKEAVLQVAIIGEPSAPVDVCSSFSVDLEVRNAGTGDLIDPLLSFEIPGDASSLSLDQIRIEYPSGSGDFQPISHSLSGNTVTVTLSDHTAIGINSGIQGSLNAADLSAQIANIQLDLSVQCNFVSNTAITYTVTGNNPCDTPATGSGSRSSTNPIVVNGAVPFYDAVSTMTIPNGNTFSGCETETIGVESVVVGGPTGTTDFARIVLPDGLEYVPGSFVATSANSAVFNRLDVVGNHQEILLNMPSGVNNGEVISYTLGIRPKDEALVCSPNSRISVQNFVTVNTLTCNGVSCGISEIPTGDTFEDVVIQKAELAEAALGATATYNYDNTNDTYEYSLEFAIENTGLVDLASGFTYDVYCSDGLGGTQGTPIYTGVVGQGITAGANLTENVTFTAASFCGPLNNLMVVLSPSSTNCHCDNLAIEAVVSDPIPPVFTDCPTDITVDASDPASCGATVTWTPPTVTDNSGTVTVSSNNYNPGDTFLPGTTAVVYTATDPSGNTSSCSFFVTVVDTISPEINGPGDQLLATDPGLCTTDYNFSLTALDNCIMSTGIYPITTDFEVPSRDTLTADCWAFQGSTLTTTNPISGNTSFYTAEIEPGVTRSLISPLTYFNGTGQIEFAHQLQDFAGDITTLTVSLEDESMNLSVIYVYTYADLILQNAAIPVTQSGNFRVRIDFDTDIKRNTNKRARLDNLLIPGTKISDPNLGCASPSLEIVQTGGLPSGSSFPIGVTTNTFEVVDAYGNIGTYSFNVEVEDNENPTASNPAPLSFNCPSEVPAPDPEVVIDEADNCTLNPAVAFVSETASGTNPMILTRVYSVSDDAGNSIQVQQEITIMDNEAPVPIVNPLPDLMVECGEDIVTFPEATDNCVGTVIGTTNDPLTYAEEGNYTITWTYDDGNGNTSEQTQNVIVTCTVDVSVSKTANLMQVALGDNLTFTITAENLSTLEATNIEIEDLLDPSFEFAFASATHGNYDETTGIWQISLLNPGEIATLDITVVVLDADGTTNVAEMVLVDQVDFNPSNDRSEVTISVIFSECLTVYNEFSPNGDGLNEVFFIECIEQYPNNNLKVYNRWGNLVYEMDGYDNSWDGISMGRATISQNEKLPVGTYYYILEPNDGQTPVQTGWLYITR